MTGAKETGRTLFGGAVKALLVHGGRALTLRRSDYDGYMPGAWECPGGRMEAGETPAQAILREIREETGIRDVRIVRMLYATVFSKADGTQVLLLVYLCEAGTDAVTLSDEHTDYRWAGKQTLAQLLHPSITEELAQFGTWELLDLLDE